MPVARLIQQKASPRHDFGIQVPSFGPMRRYRSQWLDRRGEVRDADLVVPANPLLDAAHSAFARGTLITTTSGPMAVEDLLPGDRVVTAAQGPLPLRWIGSMTLPSTDRDGSRPRFTRIMTDALGLMRPLSDLMVGPGARLRAHPRRLRARFGSEPVLTPAHVVADGMQIIDVIPRQPVTLYHLCLDRHAIITANGLETESFHPGVDFERGLDRTALRQFLDLFPHVEAPGDFGPLAHMRLPLDTPEALDI